MALKASEINREDFKVLPQASQVTDIDGLEDQKNGSIDPNAKIFKKQKNQFMQEYSISLNLPGYLILAACIYPKNINYFLTFEHIAFPDVKVVSFRPKNAKGNPKKSVNQTVSMLIEEVEVGDLGDKKPQDILRFKNKHECQLTVRKQNQGVGCVTIDKYRFDASNNFMKKFKFSDSGNLFAVSGNAENDCIKIFDSSDIDTFLTQKLQKGLEISQLKDEEIKQAEKVVFSGNDERLFVGTNRSILIFFIKSGNLLKRIQIPNVYDLLLSLSVQHDGRDAILFCNKVDSKVANCLRLSKIRDDNLLHSIQYTNEPNYSQIRAKVSADNKTVFLNSMSDNIIYYDQRQVHIPWFKDKSVIKLEEITSFKSKDGLPQTAFLCVIARNYDNQLTIAHTHDPNFRVDIDRQVTPGNYKVNDLMIKNEIVKILSVRDGEIFIDTFKLQDVHTDIDMDPLHDGKQSIDKNKISNYYEATFKSQVFEWPLFAYIYQTRDIILISANLPNVMFRFTIPDQKEVLSQVFITERLELYYLTILDDKFQIYKIDGLTFTNLQKAFKEQTDFIWEHKPVMTYDSSQVDHRGCYSFFVKSSTVAQSNNSSIANLIKSDARCFVLHKKNLYTCIEGEKEIELIGKVFHVRFVGADTIFYSCFLNEESKGGEKGGKYCVNKISIVYSNYKVETVYTEFRANAKIDNYSYDFSLNRLYILVSIMNQGSIFYEILIVDVKSSQILSKLDITKNWNLIGQMRCGINFLINGNFYYQNSIMRLDPLNKKHNLYQTYENVMPLTDQEFMIFVSPMVSLSHRRILFIKKDRGTLALRTGIIMPFLDERILVLNTKSNIPELWTLIEEKSNDNESVQKLKTLSPNAQISGETIDLQVGPASDQISISRIQPSQQSDNKNISQRKNGFFSMFKRLKITKVGVNQIHNKPIVPSKQKILRINSQNQTIHVYSLKGQLLKILPFFENQNLNVGDPIGISKSALTMVFMKNDNLKLAVRGIDLEKGFAAEDVQWDLDVEKLILKSSECLKLLLPDYEDINSRNFPAQKESKEIINEPKLTPERSTDKIMNEIENISLRTNQEHSIIDDVEGGRGIDIGALLLNKYKMRTKVNNYGDICIMLIEKQNTLNSFFKQVVKQTQEDHKQGPVDNKKRIFLYIKKPLVKDQDPKLIYLSNITDFPDAGFIKNFQITRDTIYFWNDQTVYYCNPSKQQDIFGIKMNIPGWKKEQIKSLDFCIDKEDLKNSQILEVNVASDQFIVLKISLNPKLNSIIVWDVISNIEIDSYDVEKDAQVMFDKKGRIYIMEKDHIIMNDSGGRCLSYQLQGNTYNNIKIGEKNFLKFESLDRGYRVDPELQNFIIAPNNLHFGQSYLGIVINEQNSMKENADRVFDPLAYPYFINQQSELHHLVNDPSTLELLLNHYEKDNHYLLDHILLVDSNRKTPLHQALANEISRSINLLLKKLSIVRVNNSSNFKDIFSEFLDYQVFNEYLNVNFFQTLQMKSIQSLNISNPNGDDHTEGAIVVHHTNSFLNQGLIQDVQDPNSTSQPVIVKGFDLYWILNTDEGQQFLLSLSQQDNMNIFVTDFIKTLIFFLWSYYKKRIIIYVMIPYCAYFGLFIALVFYNEQYFTQDTTSFQSDEQSIMLGLTIANLVMIAYFFHIMIRSAYALGSKSLKSLWVQLTFISNSMNLAIVIMTMKGEQTLDIRRMESVSVIFMWFRFLYFFRIMDHTAYLIRMLWQILYDMRSFIFIFVLIILAFANGFYVLSNNQMDAVPETDSSTIPYSTYQDSIIFVFMTAVGQGSTDSFTIGDDVSLLWCMFVVTTFFLAIVLLNMLIAMMGQSYQNVASVAEASKMKERILMIMENFFLMRTRGFDRAKYLISFAHQQDTAAQDEILAKLILKIDKMGEEIQKIKNHLFNS